MDQHVLREYQERGVVECLERIQENPVLVLPTGGGKTTVATEIIRRFGKPTLWIAHRRELIHQAAERLRAHGLACGVIMAQVAATAAPVQVASIQTLVRRQCPATGLLVIDEAHHATGNSYQSIVARFPGIPRLGLTATPFRLDGRGLGGIFGIIIEAATPKQLVASGILHAPKVWAGKAPDLKGVRVRQGDYVSGVLSLAANTTEIIGDIVATWQRRSGGVRTVAFAVDVAHSRSIAAAFQGAGIAAEHLDGTTPIDERAAILARLASGETRIVCNCQVLGEGVDIPALECAIIARPTASLGLHRQQIGRIMRICEGKSGAIVLDHAGNHHAHGLVTRDIAYSLEPDRKIIPGPPGIRRCEACGAIYESKLAACPECGAVPAVKKREIRHDRNGDLVAYSASDFEWRRQVWDKLKSSGIGDDVWCRVSFKKRVGDWPVEVDGKLVNPRDCTIEEKRGAYKSLATIGRDRGFKVGWAAYRYKYIFGTWPSGFVSEVRRELGIVVPEFKPGYSR